MPLILLVVHPSVHNRICIDTICHWVKRDEVTSKYSIRTEELRRSFTADEIDKCRTKLQSHKAAGEDEIVNEFRVNLGRIGMLKKKSHFCTTGCGRTRTRRSGWREGMEVELFKKQDKIDPGNYRGV